MTIDRRRLIGTAAVASAIGSAAAAASPDAVDAHVRARIEAKGIPGLAVTIVRDGRVWKQAAYGKADIELGVPATPDTVFAMASASKFLAGLCALLLAEAGRLDLDAPASAYLPEMAARHAEVRVRHLLELTHGLAGPGRDPAFSALYQRRESAGEFVDARKVERVTPAEQMAALLGQPARTAPGAVWAYDNVGHLLFGQIVERVTGQAYDAFVRTALFDRLGMGSAAFGDHRALIPGKRSTNYSRQSGVLQNLAVNYTPAYWAAAGCNASAADMGALLAGLTPGRLLSAESLARMATPTRLADGTLARYGLGCTVLETDGRTWIGHEGGGCCYLGWWPRERVGVAVQMNLSGSGEDGIEAALAALALA